VPAPNDFEHDDPRPETVGARPRTMLIMSKARSESIATRLRAE
jgi:hypothetical protein